MNKLERRQKGIARARRVLRVYRSCWFEVHHGDGYYDEGGEYEKTLIKTRVPCSCGMCGNPRKLGEITRQEIRANDEQI